MSFCSFGDNYALFDITPVENMFLQEFMLRAPGNYVKAYLYGLMQCYHPAEAMSLARMARDMDMAEDEVFQAFQYWERMGLLRRVADSPPEYVYKNLKHKLLMPGGEGDSVYRYKDFNVALHNLFDKKRKLHEQDYRRVYEWIEVLGLPETVAIMLIRYCIDQYGLRFSFEKADALAREWAEQGVRTIEDAEEITRYSKQLAEDLKQVLRRLGQRRAPSIDEQDLYRKWTGDWGFTLPAILEACKETVKGAPTMAYLGGILERQHKLGLHRAEEIAGKFKQESEQAEPVKEIYLALGRRGIAPTAEDLRLVGEWTEKGVAPDLMALAAQVAHHNGGNSMESVRLRLEAWLSKGLNTRDAVDGYLGAVRRDNAQLAALFEACGESRKPTAADRAHLAQWRGEWAMPHDLLLLAAEYAANASAKTAFMHRVLSEWRDKGIATVEAARAERARHVAARDASGSSTARAAPEAQPASPLPVREVAQHRYTQRQYAPEELDALVFDPYREVAAEEVEGRDGPT